MKTRFSNYYFGLGFLIFIFTSCIGPKGPSDEEVKKVIGNQYNGENTLLLEFSILDKGSSQNMGGDIKAFQIKCRVKYIAGGINYAYQHYPQHPEYWEKFCKGLIEIDREIEEEKDFLFSKDQWGEWKIIDSKQLSSNQIQTFQRPVIKSVQEFYKDKLK